MHKGAFCRSAFNLLDLLVVCVSLTSFFNVWVKIYKKLNNLNLKIKIFSSLAPTRCHQWKFFVFSVCFVPCVPSTVPKAWRYFTPFPLPPTKKLLFLFLPKTTANSSFIYYQIYFYLFFISFYFLHTQKIFSNVDLFQTIIKKILDVKKLLACSPMCNCGCKNYWKYRSCYMFTAIYVCCYRSSVV